MDVGQKVEHILSKDWMMVLEVIKLPTGGHKVLCRTKDLREIWFFSFELVSIQEGGRMPKKVGYGNGMKNGNKKNGNKNGKKK